jgi:hypothetical protein
VGVKWILGGWAAWSRDRWQGMKHLRSGNRTCEEAALFSYFPFFSMPFSLPFSIILLMKIVWNQDLLLWLSLRECLLSKCSVRKTHALRSNLLFLFCSTASMARPFYGWHSVKDIPLQSLPLAQPVLATLMCSVPPCEHKTQIPHNSVSEECLNNTQGIYMWLQKVITP